MIFGLCFLFGEYADVSLSNLDNPLLIILLVLIGLVVPIIGNLRPEKISFAASGLAGRVKTRIFQGNHWLYQIDTDRGLITVIRQNSGEAMPAEGEGVHLSWAAQ